MAKEKMWGKKVDGNYVHEGGGGDALMENSILFFAIPLLARKNPFRLLSTNVGSILRNLAIV